MAKKKSRKKKIIVFILLVIALFGIAAYFTSFSIVPEEDTGDLSLRQLVGSSDSDFGRDKCGKRDKGYYGSEQGQDDVFSGEVIIGNWKIFTEKAHGEYDWCTSDNFDCNPTSELGIANCTKIADNYMTSPASRSARYYNMYLWSCQKMNIKTQCNDDARGCSRNEYKDCIDGSCSSSDWKECECKKVETIPTGEYTNVSSSKCSDVSCRDRALCYQQSKVYYQDDLLYTYSFEDSFQNAKNNRIFTWKSENYFDDTYLRIRFDSDSQIEPDERESCDWVMNKYDFDIPEDKISVRVMDARTNYFSGTKANITLEITNAATELNAKIWLFGGVPVSLYGSETMIVDNVSKMMTLKKGVQYVTFQVPTQQIYSEIYFQPAIDITLDQEKLSGINAKSSIPITYYVCYSSGREKVTRSTQYYPANLVKAPILTRIIGEEYMAMITPSPIYIDEPMCNMMEYECPSDYVCEQTGISKDGTKEYGCLREDIVNKELSCQQLGCEFVNKSNYACTSSGVCAEVVYVYQDCRNLGCDEGVCQSDGTCLINNTISKTLVCGEDYFCGVGQSCIFNLDNSSYCVASVLTEVINQCEVAEDCQTMCNGIVASCNKGVCDYSGSCTALELDCRDFGCGEGSECVAVNENYVCQTTLKQESNIGLITGLIIAVLVLVFILIIVTKKKRGKKKKNGKK